MKNIDNSISLIRQFAGLDAKISQPTFGGEHHQIYIVETNNKKNVFRFSSHDYATKNRDISKLLRKHNIPVPDVQICMLGGECLETYPFLEGKTLYQRHQEGISGETTKKVYTQLCDICYRMSQIPATEFKDLDLPVCKTDTFFKLLNNSPRVICHCDLNDKNVLLDNKDDVCAILDLDSICLKTFELSMLLLFTIAQEKGYEYTPESVKDFFPSIYHEKSLLNLGQQYAIYMKFVKFKNRLLDIKQLLKIPLK